MNVTKKHFTVVNRVENNPDNTIIIVGAAADGPSRMPILVDNTLDPFDVFGQSPLADAYTAVRSTGATKIITYRINGAHSKALIQYSDISEARDIIRLTSISASDKYNDIYVTVYPDYIYIDETQIGGSVRSYLFEEYPTAYEVAYAINRDAFYGLISFTAEAVEEDFSMMDIVSMQTIVKFSEGLVEEEFLVNRNEEGSHVFYINIAKNRLAEALFGYDPTDQAEHVPNGVLGILSYGVILLADMFHDDTIHDEETDKDIPVFTPMLGQFCMNKGKTMESGCIGVIGTRPLINIDDESIASKTQELVSITGACEDEEFYNYVQVVVGDSTYSRTMDSMPNAYGYAGAQSLYPYHIMMTNKKISGFGELNYEIGKEDIALLSSNGYICIVPSIRRGFVPYLVSTYGKNRKLLLSKPHCIRIAQYVSRVMAYEYDSFIGGVLNSVTKKDITNVGENILKKMLSDGVIKGYSIECDFIPGSMEATVEAMLIPHSEVTAVNTVTVVAFPREVI